MRGARRSPPTRSARATPAEEAYGAGHGVCQDFAHIFIAVARRLAIPARYVSGHLFRRDGAHLQPAAHAWTEAWVDDLGWVAFDPANGISTDDAYVRVAAGLDYRDASPIAGARVGGGAEALATRRGVCQDFAHIFIALAREAGIPARYVSGYLFRRTEEENRHEDATHSWVECYLPSLGWCGFDPTNNEEAGDGHIRVAVGRDYADVPPTRGVYKGVAAVRTELAVAVRVTSVAPPVVGDVLPFTPWMSRDAGAPLPESADTERQQQQQQQQ